MGNKLTTKDFIERSKEVHGDRYDYSKVKYINYATKLTIICKSHGEFLQRGGDHLRKKGCKACAMEKLFAQKAAKYKSEYLDKANKKHNHKYAYLSVPSKSKEKVLVVCRTHGEFLQSANSHLRGAGCKKCSDKVSAEQRIKLAGRKFLIEVKQKLPQYSYTKTKYNGGDKKITVTCKLHGDFITTPDSLMNKLHNGCYLCGLDRQVTKRSMTASEFTERSKTLFPGLYTYERCVFKDLKTKVTLHCESCGYFKVKPSGHLYDYTGCPKCKPMSKPESELRKFVESLGFKSESINLPYGETYREIDIFIEEKNIGIEFNGIYFHSEKFKERLYHINKTKLAEENGIELIHVWENDWKEKKEIIKSRIKAILGKSNRIFARKTKVVELSWKEVTTFLNDHHLKGAGQTSKIRYGLVYNSKLVAVMTAGNARFKNEGLEIYRYASAGQVIGGMSKLLKHIEREHLPTSIISFADRCWGPGKVYEAIGFEKKSESKPSYVWVKSMRVKSRFSMQKHKLHSILKDFDPSMSEAENCHANGWYKLYDCGTVKWEKKL